jgi:hypothetical protein
VEKATDERRRYTAFELRTLPLDQRNTILKAQAAEAEQAYRDHPELMDFEAFGEEYLDGDEPESKSPDGPQ